MRNWQAVLITAIGPILWGSTYIVTTEILPPDRPFIAAALRTIPAGLLLILFTRRSPQRNEWLATIILATLNLGFFQAMLFVAAYRLPGGLAAVLGATQPLMIMAIVWVAERLSPGWAPFFAALLGVVGTAALLLAPDAQWDSVGTLAAGAGAFSMALGTYLTRRWIVKLPILAFTGWQLFIGGLVLVPVALLVDPPLQTLSALELGGYVYLSLGGALLAYVVWFKGVAQLSPVAVSSLILLSPVTAVILGWTLLDQAMRGWSLFGLLAVLLSILLVQLTSRPAS